MCKVSVITPVYKVEKYLGKCIDSILNQSFKDFELIIVDDGSPDSCGKIADEYEKIDSRVKVIHKENGGAPSARNAGIEIAKGEYFYFPDSDDWLDPEYLQELVVLAEKTHAELVISGFTMEYYEQGNLGMNVFSYLALAVALLTVPRLFEDRTLYIIISATIFLTSVGMEWLYKALEQYTYITIRSIIFKFIALVAMFLFVHEKSDYVIYGGISIFASSASNVFNFINIHKYIDLKPLPKYNVKRHIKLVFIFFAMSCAITVYTNLDTVMLGFMSSNTDVGYYNAAVKIKHILVSLVTSLGTVLLPRSTYYIEKGQINEFKRISNKALNFVALVATPMTIYFILFAKQGIYFLSGNAYDGAILPMQIIMPTLILIGITNIFGTQMLVPLGKEKIVFYSEVSGAIVDILINAALIPLFASAGAAFGTLLAEFVVLLVQFHGIKEYVKGFFKKIHSYKIMIAIMIASIISIWINRLSIGSFLILVISATIFFGTYFLILLFWKDALVVEIWNGVLDKCKKIVRK